MIGMTLLCVVTAATVKPVGAPQEVLWGKNVGYVVSGSATFEVNGETGLVFDIFGPAGLRGKEVTVEIIRNDAFVSTNTLKFRGGEPSPKEYVLSSRVGLQLKENKQTVKFVTSEKLIVSPRLVPKVAKPVLAAAEKPVPKTAQATAAAAPTPKASPSASASSPSPAPASASANTAVATKTAPKAADIMAASSVAAERVAELGNGEAAGAGSVTGLQQALRIAVYDFELQGVDPNVGAVVTDSTLSEVRKLQGVSAIGMDEIRDMLSHEANKQVLGCESNESCLAEIAGALGVDDLVTGTLTKTETEHVFVLRRIDQKRAKVVGSVNRRLKAESGQEFLAAIGPAIEELFPDRQLKSGMERGVAKEVALRLDPPPLPKWSFYAVGGGAAASLIAGGVFGLLARRDQQEYDKTAKSAIKTPVEGSVLVDIGNRMDREANMANGFFIGSGALAIAAGVMYLFTDFEGYADASK